MIPRHLTKTLARAARHYPIVTLTGPRQSGKTTLLRHLFKGFAYRSLESPDERQFAVDDPRGFLKQFKTSVILDEVQRVPDLFSYLQVFADDNPRMGQFILSGSQNFLLLRNVTQSLAGRAYISHLMPFSLAELNCRPFHGSMPGAGLPRTKPLEGEWMELAVKGGYPPIHDRSLDPGEWLSRYFQTYLQRDVRDVKQVGDLNAFSRFVRLCAGRAGQLMNLSGLGNDCGISHDTARRWLSILETGFVVFLLRPHHTNFRKRLTRSPKLYFMDPGLLCYLLQIETPAQLERHAMKGAVFENFIIAELIKHFYNGGRDPRLSFWRDHRGNEVDLIVETGDGVVPVEMKAGATVAGDYFKGLRYWENLTGEKRGILVYGGDTSARREGVSVRSWRQWP